MSKVLLSFQLYRGGPCWAVLVSKERCFSKEECFSLEVHLSLYQTINE